MSGSPIGRRKPIEAHCRQWALRALAAADADDPAFTALQASLRELARRHSPLRVELPS